MSVIRRAPEHAIGGASADDEQLRSQELRENFPVALRVLPAGVRADLRAVYGVARTIDELGDSAAGDRTARLEEFRTDLHSVWLTGEPRHPVLRNVRATVRSHALDAEPFDKLIEANLMDQKVVRYQSFEDLIGYCRLSADPIGHLVLAVFDQSSPEAIALSDRVCTALQLLEHWQDVAEDHRAGRIYLPQEDLEAYGVREADLDGHEATPALRALMLFETSRANEWLESGAPILGHLRGWARVAVAGYIAGGRAAASALRRTGGDVLTGDATPRRLDVVRALAVLLGRGATSTPGASP